MGYQKIGSAGIWTIMTKELSRIVVEGGIKYFQLFREGRKEADCFREINLGKLGGGFH